VAFDGYHERYDEADEPPNPTVFYNGVQYEDSPLAVVQFWLYSAFDQFTANFHWHDWEVLHVFVDLDTGDPQLYVASSHTLGAFRTTSFDPDSDAVPRILSELGSHSSTLSVNEIPDQFQRVGEEGLLADITNTTIDTVEDLFGIPLAYGLPATRGCGSRSSFRSTRANPLRTPGSLLGHRRLTGRRRTHDSVARRVGVAPDRPPFRETGIAFRHRERTTDGDGTADSDDAALADEVAESVVGYDLVKSGAGGDFGVHRSALSFEFAVPEIVEDAVASHITTTSVPWEQPRYQNPALDITAGNHRSELADRYDAIAAEEESFGDAATGELDAVVARVTQATENDDAPPDGGG